MPVNLNILWDLRDKGGGAAANRLRIGLQINGPRFESGRGRCVESLGKALYSHCPKEKAFTLASISYLANLVKYILAKK